MHKENQNNINESTNNQDKINNVLGELIIGRVEPHIYAFKVTDDNRLNEWIKVGWTSRPVMRRLEEWSNISGKQIRELKSWPSTTDDGKYFMDDAVHIELSNNDYKRHKLDKDNGFFSDEFFQLGDCKPIEKAICTIKESYNNKEKGFIFYDEDKCQVEYHYKRSQDFGLRPNQETTVKNFQNALENGKRDLLMYAVMRFGKSFTAMQCALKLIKDNKPIIVIIVSAKADVKEEWKYTVESHNDFKDFVFADKDYLQKYPTLITECKEGSFKEKNSDVQSKKSIAIFLTLQDLQGEKLKEEHKQVFENQIDLLVVDESHYGARAKKYGEVLTRSENSEDEEDDNEIKETEEAINKSFGRASVKLHLSGTPYRILMGDEFDEDSIIANFKFSDIAAEKEEWDEKATSEYKEKLKNGTAEKQNLDLILQQNPYYGFPEMIRFAFNLSDSSLEIFKKNNENFKLSSLFKTHKRKFKNDKDVIKLLKLIDGSEHDDVVFSFLDYDKIQKGNMCRHMVFVLPWRESCDAMYNILTKKGKPNKFLRLNDYEIINIAGLSDSREKNIEEVKKKIQEAEKGGKKTISLTVNRMLTGTTVKQWDTMVFLKSTSSPQDYDQAIYRIQNQYVETYRDEEGRVFKFNKKPQTLLVDFDVNRLFILQEMRYRIGSGNNNGKTEEIEKDTKIAPLILFNKDGIKRVTATDITSYVNEYNKKRSLKDEAGEIIDDLNIINNDQLKQVLANLNPIDSKQPLVIKPSEGPTSDITGDGGTEGAPEPGTDNEGKNSEVQGKNKKEKKQEEILIKKMRTLYFLILSYSFLTESTVISLQDIKRSITETSGEKEENERIIKNLGLDTDTIDILDKHLNVYTKGDLEGKIQNANQKVNDEKLTPIEKADIALKNFGRISSAEVVTPPELAEKFIGYIPQLNEGDVILDIASKQGEFVRAIYSKYGNTVAQNVYSIPTSDIAYEFTRKVYKLLELPIEKIIKVDNKNGYGILKDEVLSSVTLPSNIRMVIGNPPYQEDGGSGGSNASAIYPQFYEFAKEHTSKYVALITSAKWTSGGRRELNQFRNNIIKNDNIEKLTIVSDSKGMFGINAEKGGICYFVYKKDNNVAKENCEYTYYHYYNEENIQPRTIKLETLLSDGLFIKDIDGDKVFKQILNTLGKSQEDYTKDSLMNEVSSDTPFGLATNLDKKSTKHDAVQLHDRSIDDTIKIYWINQEKGRQVSYIEKKDVPIIGLSKTPKQKKANGDIDKIKVYIPINSGSGLDKQVLGTPILGEKGSICSQSYIYVAFDSEDAANQFLQYYKTKFFRFLVSLIKNTPQTTQKYFKFVPKLDIIEDKDSITDEKLYKQFLGDTDNDEINELIKIIKNRVDEWKEI